MKFEVDIDVSLKDRAPDYVAQIVYHVENRQPFIVYHDKEHFVRINPASLAMVGYDGFGQHGFVCTNMDEFITRLKLFIITHENFHSCIPQIEKDAYKQSSTNIKVIDV